MLNTDNLIVNFDTLLGVERRLAGSAKARSEVYERLHRTARDLIPLDAFYLCLYEPKNRRLRFEHNGDEDGLDTPEVFPLGEGPTSRAIKLGKVLVLNHLRDEKATTFTFGDPGRRSRGAIHLPFWDGVTGAGGTGSPLGVISAQSYSRDTYGREHVNALRWLSARAVHLIRDTEFEATQEVARLQKESLRATRIIATLDAFDAHPALRQAILLDLESEANSGRQHLDTESLTTRELQTLSLKAQGLSYARIADTIGIGQETVKTHLKRAHDKSGLKDRQDLLGHLSEILCALSARDL